MSLALNKTRIPVSFASILRGMPLLVIVFLVAATVIGSKNFSYLHVNVFSVTIYITEILIGLLISALLINKPYTQFVKWLKIGWVEKLTVGYLCWGAIRFLMNPNGMEGLRDLALVYYAVLIPLVAIFMHQRRDITILGFSFLLASLVVPFVGTGSIVLSSYSETTTGAYRFLSCASGMYVAMATMIIAAFSPIWSKHSHKTVAGLLVASLWLVYGLILSSHRIVWIALLAATTILLFLSNRKLRRYVAFYILSTTMLTAIILAGLSVIGYGNIVNEYVVTRITQTIHVGLNIEDQISPSVDDQVSTSIEDQVSPSVDDQVSTSIEDQISPSVDDQVSTSIEDQVSPSIGEQVSPSDMFASNMDVDPNVAWRFAAWKQLITQTWQESPVIGIGFGEPLRFTTPQGEETEADPHNSPLAILFRTGFIGFILFLLLNIACLARLVSVVRRSANTRYTQYAAALGSVLAVVFVVSLFNVVLEGPFMGIFYWITIGCISCLTKVGIADAEAI